MRNIQRNGQTWQFRVGGPGENRRLEYNLPLVAGVLLASAAFVFGFAPLRDLVDGSAVVAGVVLALLAAALIWAGLNIRNLWLEKGRFAPYVVQIDRGRMTIVAGQRGGKKNLWSERFDPTKLHIAPAAAGMPGVKLGGTTSALVYAAAAPEAAEFAVPRRDFTLLTLASEPELVALASALSGERRFPNPPRD